MRSRFQGLFLTSLSALAILGIPSVDAQTQSRTPTPAPKAAPYKAPRTPWGDPDLQGLWPGNMGVPLQRPVEFGDRTTLTDAEFARKEAQARAQAEADAQQFVVPGTPVGLGPPSHWTERGVPTRQASLIVDPENGRLPPLTPEAEKRRREMNLPGEWRGQADSYTDMNIYYRCITRGLLGSIIPVVYGNGNQIVQTPGYVMFRHEMIHESRVIPLDGSPHVSPAIRTYMGDSRGHWEGDTLVVETSNFTDKVAIGSNGAGYPGDPGYHTEALRVTERFTRTDQNTLQYEATIDDPRTWTRPWTISMPLRRDPNYELYEYACHEGNHAMSNILSGARAAEAK
jgi:hypothetical protein